MPSPPPGGTPLLPFIAIGVLLLLLAAVIALVVRTVRQGAPPQASPEPPMPAARASHNGLSGAIEAPHGDEVDLTRMKAFSADLLPRISLDDDEDADGSDSYLAIEDTKPTLRIQDGIGAEAPAASHDLIVTSAASLSDRGKKRTRNEDACLIDSKLDFYVVADGMGGYAGGDVAANTAVAEIHKALRAGKPLPASAAALTPSDWPALGRELGVAIEHANEIIHDVSGKSKQLEGMGTTILTARFSRSTQRLYAAYVGDSRLYRLRAGKLQQLTTDHTLGERGVTGPLASNVRRAVGVGSRVKVDLLVDKPLPDDLYVLCSDGVFKMLSDQDMIRILSLQAAGSRWTEENLKERVAGVVAAANAAGGKDNITVVLVGVGDATVADRAGARSVETRA